MIVNCTNHIATKEQLEMGIVEPKNKEKIQELLTFDDIDSIFDAGNRAKKIVNIIKEEGYKYALIGGIPFFMSILENEFYINDIIPVYAFSKRNSEEKIDRYGTIIKTSLFYNKALFYKCKDSSLHFIHNNKDNK